MDHDVQVLNLAALAANIQFSVDHFREFYQGGTVKGGVFFIF